jgi:RPA family protein
MAMKKTTTVKKAAPKKTTSRVEKVMSPKAEMRKWEIESALSTLKRADEIRKDTKMMADVKKLAQEQMSVLKTFSK